MKVGIATGQDLTEISVMFERSYSVLLAPDYEGDLLRTALPIMGRARPALVTSGRFFTVRHAGKLVGAGGWSPHAPGNPLDRTNAHVRHVATDPSALRMGVGSALMKAIFAQARASDVAQLMALSTRTAVPFYAHHGFRRLRDITVPLGGRVAFPCVEMLRVL
ncbi:MAG: GNAT family N-acetyltransferase [Pseudomonadota bacterium]